MGFPVGYSALPGLLLHAILLLGRIHRLISWAFTSIGLGNLLDSHAPQPNPSTNIPLHRPELFINDILPVIRYEFIGRCPQENCAVCLQEINGHEEVHKLSNCRHTFHRHCLHQWMGHAHRTCPLCRAPLFLEVKGGSPYDWFFDYEERDPFPAMSTTQLLVADT